MEKRLLAQLNPSGATTFQLVAGVDEVGRGAIAGPVSVGICVVGMETADEFPTGLRDSKLLSPAARERLVDPVQQWAVACTVGHASAAEIDAWGILGGLRAAAARAYAQLGDLPIGVVLLDGVHNWWETPLFSAGPTPPNLPVQLERKGDARCAVIAGASVVAKVARDSLMVQLADQITGYDWESNKGYASAAHVAGLAKLGVSSQHRKSWKLPGISPDTLQGKL
ncbi:MAG: ribonuclease HII [Trueperella sp.]|nr:ribonuclease HII [Trueperella sp.]